MDDPAPDAVALAWWTGLSPRERGRYRRRISCGRDLLLPRHALELAAAGLAPARWWIVGPEASATDNDVVHRFEVILGGGRDYVMPDPVRRVVLTDLARTSLDDLSPDDSSGPRWHECLRSRSR